MIKILNKFETPKYYRISHARCCEFIATPDEFTLKNWGLETNVDMVCPVCNKQFYGDFKHCDENGNISNS